MSEIQGIYLWRASSGSTVQVWDVTFSLIFIRNQCCAADTDKRRRWKTTTCSAEGKRTWRRAWNGMNEVNPCYVELSGLALAITEITITTSLLHPSESTCVCTCVSDICKEPSKNLTSKKGFLYINRFCRIAKSLDAEKGWKIEE